MPLALIVPWVLCSYEVRHAAKTCKSYKRRGKKKKKKTRWALHGLHVQKELH